ncbi:MAG: hypothetical protein U0670_06885 [Anaerolineae bacterium]
MGCEVKWLREGQIVYIRFYGYMSIEDAATANRQGLALTQSSDTPVHILIDGREVTGILPSLAKLRDAIRNVDRSKTGFQALVIGKNSLLRFIGSVLMQLFSGKDGSAVVTTYEEGMEAIEQVIRINEARAKPAPQSTDP